MSRGGGGGRGGKVSGVTALANHLGLQRGEIVTQAVSQPPPLFPPLDVKPLSLSDNDDQRYMVALKNEFSNRLRESAYFLKDKEPKKDIERYSDKYRKSHVEPWTPYYNRIPKELWPKYLASGAPVSKPPPAKRRKIDHKGEADANFSKKFEDLEKREKRGRDSTVDDAEAESSKKKKTGEEEEEEDAEGKDDEEQEMSDDDYREEDNDYIQNYFDNGDNYLDDSEENLDDEAFY